MYEIEFVDGRKQALSANMIAVNMFASIDEKGHRHLLIDSIIGFRKIKEAIGKEGAIVLSSNENKRRIETTIGYQIDLQWRDGSTT